MKRFDSLLSKHCPDGVEYKNLNEVFDWLNGMTAVSKKWKQEGNCVFIDYMNVYKNIRIDINDTPYATVKNVNQTKIKKGDVLFTAASEMPDECALAAEVEDDINQDIFIDDHLFGLRIKSEYEMQFVAGYLKYAFRSNAFRKQLRKAVRGVTRFYISKKSLISRQISNQLNHFSRKAY